MKCEAAGAWVYSKDRAQNESICGHAAARFPLLTTPRLRWLSSVGSGLSQQEIKKKIDEITDLFMEARELLSDAVASKDTIYFHEDLEDATAAVKETLALYNQLLEQLTEEQRNDVVRAIGLKMEELKAQESMIQEMKK
ncbi:Hypp5175 [Branchiostoma lanceolatum]|uniref:Hypp5175 protein n=1 Tax=Branchiostoma lanceolatum TaxID=7740 RepID=A0A8K0F3L6_BRALA|nr:Hypp5175 [Branchiostoma lanceolatum]